MNKVQDYLKTIALILPLKYKIVELCFKLLTVIKFYWIGLYLCKGINSCGLLIQKCSKSKKFLAKLNQISD